MHWDMVEHLLDEDGQTYAQDEDTQSTGDAGSRLACGVIE